MRTGPSWVRPATAVVALATIPLGAWLAVAELAALVAVMAVMLLAERRVRDDFHGAAAVPRS